MLLRKKCDTEGANFSGDGGDHEIYVCAERLENGKVQLYEQVDGVEKEGPHSITRKVVVDEEFIKELHDRVCTKTST